MSSSSGVVNKLNRRWQGSGPVHLVRQGSRSGCRAGGHRHQPQDRNPTIDNSWFNGASLAVNASFTVRGLCPFTGAACVSRHE